MPTIYTFSVSALLQQSDAKSEFGDPQKSLDPTENDDCHAPEDRTAYGHCQKSVDSESFKLESDSFLELVDMDGDESSGGPPKGKFLEVESLIRHLL